MSATHFSTQQPDGYLALPPAGKGRPVLVLHPWWGLNETIRAFCRRLASEGFTVFAPDLYHGQVTDQIAEAERLSGALDEAQAHIDVLTAAAWLRMQSEAAPLAVIGFSLGAYFALALAAAAAEGVCQVVLFYGTGPADFKEARAAYLGHFAEDDPYEPAENVEWLEGELRSAGRPVTFYRYPGVGHWFFEPDRADAYDGDAAELAWRRTLAFLG